MSYPIGKPAASKRRILVIDDDEAVRAMLGRVLAEAGYLAVPAAACSEAVRLFDRTNFDLALLDLGMRGEDGWTTLTQLHARDAEFPVIIITAWPHQQASAWTAGAIGCFEKPLDFTDLLVAIARVFVAGGSARATGPIAVDTDQTPSPATPPRSCLFARRPYPRPRL